MQADFDEFPDDDPFASIQDSGDPDCEKWKKDVAAAQAKLNKEGRILQAKINETKKALYDYNEALEKAKKECNSKCGMGKYRILQHLFYKACNFVNHC